jgi:hypothetical protein
VGANSKQGWCLFAFLIGFTFLPAGLAYLGPIFTLIGLACLIGASIGFVRIKPLEHVGVSEPPQMESTPPRSHPDRVAAR